MKFVILFIVCIGIGCEAKHRSDLEVQEGIDYINSRIPRIRNGDSSGERWTSDYKEIIKALLQHPKFSKWVEESTEERMKVEQSSKGTPFNFNCNPSSSGSVPTSVHKLRPGDIKVIGAIGDSLTSANGALAKSIIGVVKQDRGYAWSIGGQLNVNSHSTLASILKANNNNLYGYSTGTGTISSVHSVLNVAEPGKVADEMPAQAVSLVNKLKADSKVNFNNDWKVITFFVGGNDLCRYCKDKTRYSPAKYIENIRLTLDHLHKNVPRALVNVAEVLDVSVVKKLQTTDSLCRILTGSFLCACAAKPQDDAAEQELLSVTAQYQKGVRDLVASGRYDTREDFTVVNQPFYRGSKEVYLPNGNLDMSYFAPDCFHFSAKGHIEAGKALWNNMLEQEGKKSTSWTPNGKFLCPTSARPYFATRKN